MWGCISREYLDTIKEAPALVWLQLYNNINSVITQSVCWNLNIIVIPQMGHGERPKVEIKKFKPI